jgi:hypothetical protein
MFPFLPLEGIAFCLVSLLSQAMRNFIYKDVGVRIGKAKVLMTWEYGGNREKQEILCPKDHPPFKNEQEADDYMEQIAKGWIDGQLES